MSIDIKPNFDRLIRKLPNEDLEAMLECWSARHSSFSKNISECIEEEIRKRRKKCNAKKE